MTKKIFLSGIYHETHTFLSQLTTLNDFQINIDDEIIKKILAMDHPLMVSLNSLPKKAGILFPVYKCLQDLLEQ